MDDFTIRISNLPENEFYKGDLDNLKIKIWCHINLIINEDNEENY